MIPAIISCVFVLYLYRTLNSPDVDSKHLPSDTDPAAPMMKRVDALQARLEELASRLETKDRS